MGWFTKNSVKTAKKKGTHNTPTRVFTTDFRAVKVIPCRSACHDAMQLKDRVFLAREAPLLPSQNCNRGLSCSCHYFHMDDRRQIDRREVDNGLPNRHVNSERRASRDRRRSQYVF